MAIAASGLAASAAWLERIASEVVDTGPAPSAPQSSPAQTVASSGATVNMPTGDFANAMIDQTLALANFRADATAFAAAETLMQSTLDVMA